MYIKNGNCDITIVGDGLLLQAEIQRQFDLVNAHAKDKLSIRYTKALSGFIHTTINLQFWVFHVDLS